MKLAGRIIELIIGLGIIGLVFYCKMPLDQKLWFGLPGVILVLDAVVKLRRVSFGSW